MCGVSATLGKVHGMNGRVILHPAPTLDHRLAIDNLHHHDLYDMATTTSPQPTPRAQGQRWLRFILAATTLKSQLALQPVAQHVLLAPPPLRLGLTLSSPLRLSVCVKVDAAVSQLMTYNPPTADSRITPTTRSRVFPIPPLRLST